MAATRRASAASRVFLAFLGAVAVITVLLAVLLAVQAQATERAEAETVTLAVARTIAEMPDVQEAVTSGSDAAATAALQPLAERIMDETSIDFVTIMTTEGIRLTHADPGQIGKRYLGTIGPGLEGRTLTEEDRPRTTTASAASAPAFMARSISSPARARRLAESIVSDMTWPFFADPFIVQ